MLLILKCQDKLKKNGHFQDLGSERLVGCLIALGLLTILTVIFFLPALCHAPTMPHILHALENKISMKYIIFLFSPKIDMKKLHGSTLQNVSLMSTVLVSKKKISQRYSVLTLGFPSNPNIKLQPGDHINVFPDNDPQVVCQVIKRLAEVPKENEIVVWKGKHSLKDTTKKNTECCK